MTCRAFSVVSERHTSARSAGRRILELVDDIEGTVDQSTLEVPDEQKDLIERRATELAADPPIGLSWSELDARLGNR